MSCGEPGICAALNLSIEATPKRSAEAAAARGRRVVAARRPATAMRRSVTGGGTNFSIANGLVSGRSDLFQAGPAELGHDVLPFGKVGQTVTGPARLTT